MVNGHYGMSNLYRLLTCGLKFDSHRSGIWQKAVIFFLQKRIES